MVSLPREAAAYFKQYESKISESNISMIRLHIHKQHEIDRFIWVSVFWNLESLETFCQKKNYPTQIFLNLWNNK